MRARIAYISYTKTLRIFNIYFNNKTFLCSVRVVNMTFAQGKTSVKKSYNPEFKEVLNFVDMFPPLSNRIRVQLCDSDIGKDDSIGTHFIELSQIMDPGAGDAEGKTVSFASC